MVEETSSVTTLAMKIPLVSACADNHAFALCAFVSAAVLLTRRDNSPCYNDACVRSPHRTSMVETSNNLFRYYIG